MDYQHEPVAVEEVMGLMALGPGATVVDCCVGFGGHASRFLAETAPNGFLLGTDLDAAALDTARERLSPFGGRFELVRANYTQIPELMRERDIPSAQAVFLDLGVCSLHFDRDDRGFSVHRDGPLDMRMGRGQTLTAETIVNEWTAEQLAQIFHDYGDERRARDIAQAIVTRRRASRLTSTLQLAALVEQIKGRSKHGVHAATHVFQALRVSVNRELENLASILSSAPHILAPGGSFVVISYHSKEDRLVKESFRSARKEGLYSDVTRKPVVPSPQTVAANPRSRSAKIRRAVRA